MEFSKTIEADDAHHVEKGWGSSMSKISTQPVGEIWCWQKSDEKIDHVIKVETVKALFMNKGKKLSLHFHDKKEEMFCVILGSFFVETIDKKGKKVSGTYGPGERIFIPRCTPHRMTGTSDQNVLIEISTHHDDEDSFRIEKGD